MKLSEAGLEALIFSEGSRSKPYKDAAGLWTIGVGHLLTRDELMSGKINIGGRFVKYHDGLSADEVKGLLSQDVIGIEKAVASVRSLHKWKFDALVNFVFNIGPSAFRGSTLYQKLLAKEFDSVPAQMRRWVWAGGKKIDGLRDRREREIAIWLRGDYYYMRGG